MERENKIKYLLAPLFGGLANILFGTVMLWKESLPPAAWAYAVTAWFVVGAMIALIGNSLASNAVSK